MQRRIIAPEIKAEVLAKAKTGEKVSALADQYGISIKTIYTWLRVDTGEAVVSVARYNRVKRENEELKKLVGELTLNVSLGGKN